MDLAKRIEQMMEFGGPLALVLLCLFVLFGLTLAGLGRRRLLLTMYIMAMPFSGFPVTSVDAVSTLFRWFCMFMIAFTCFRGMSFPGWGSVFYGVVGGLAVLMGLYGPIPWYSTQRAGLVLVLALPFAAAVAEQLSSSESLVRLLKVFVVAAGLLVLLGVLGFRDVEEGAYNPGVLGRAGTLSITGGLLMPWLLWGSMAEGIGKKWRWTCILLYCALAGIIAVTGRRGGLVAGLIGSVPIIAKLGFRRLKGALVLGVLLALTVLVFAVVFPVQYEYVIGRYSDMGMSGRDVIWARAWEACTEHPWVGRGMNSEYEVVSNGFHNAWLKVWYETGFFGLILFAGVFVVGGLQALRGMLPRNGHFVRDAARLSMGLLMASGAIGMVESGLFGPGTMPAFTLIMAAVLAHRLKHFTREEQAMYVAMYSPDGMISSPYGAGVVYRNV